MTRLQAFFLLVAAVIAAFFLAPSSAGAKHIPVPVKIPDTLIGKFKYHPSAPIAQKPASDRALLLQKQCEGLNGNKKFTLQEQQDVNRRTSSTMKRFCAGLSGSSSSSSSSRPGISRAVTRPRLKLTPCNSTKTRVSTGALVCP